MGTKHTPGPWRSVIATDGAFAIESAEAVLFLRAPWPGRVEESKADARLIAAAPDLLAALEVVRDMLVEVVTYTHTPDVENDPVWRDIYGRGADCLRTATAAIAKATGG